MKPALNPREEHLLKSIMKSMVVICPTGSPIYYEMAVKLIQQQYMNPLSTAKGKQMLMTIVQKIAYAQMDEELESILAEVEEIEIEIDSTKAQSLKKTHNITERHRELIAMLFKFPISSRRELAVHLGWSINMTTPRVKELIDFGKIEVVGTKYDSKTERNVESLALI